MFCSREVASGWAEVGSSLLRTGTEGQRKVVVVFPPGSHREAWAEFGTESVPTKFQRLHFHCAVSSLLSSVSKHQHAHSYF